MNSDGTLSPIAASEVLGRRLGSDTGKKRMDLIIEKDNAPALVRALPTEDLYFLVKDVGLDDAAPLVAMASPDQFRGFVDLDCWHPIEGGREVSAPAVLSWLAVARAGGDEEDVAAKRRALDLEVLEIVLLGGIRIVDKNAVDEDGWAVAAPGEDPDARWEDTPCGSWLVSYQIHGEEGIELRRMLAEIYAEDPFLASRFLAVLRHELGSDLNEHALRFRTARMEDMGFPAPDVAASLYAKVDPAVTPPPQPAPPDTVPGFLLSEFSGASLLDRSAALVTGVKQRTRLDRSLMYLANCAMVADGVDPADSDAAREAIGRMRAYLNLGLHQMAGGEPAAGASILLSAALRHVFQVGFTLTLQRKWRADRMVADLGARFGPKLASNLSLLLDAPEGQVIIALSSRRPRYPLALDAARQAGWPASPALEESEGASDAGSPEGVRPFALPEDLEAVDLALERIEGMTSLASAAGLLRHVGAEAADTPEHPTLSASLLAAALNEAAGKAFAAAPLTPGDVRFALERVAADDGGLTQDAAKVLVDELASRAPDHARWAEPLVALASSRLRMAHSNVEREFDLRLLGVLVGPDAR